jgi:hypothetical protein
VRNPDAEAASIRPNRNHSFLLSDIAYPLEDNILYVKPGRRYLSSGPELFMRISLVSPTIILDVIGSYHDLL